MKAVERELLPQASEGHPLVEGVEGVYVSDLFPPATCHRGEVIGINDEALERITRDRPTLTAPIEGVEAEVGRLGVPGSRAEG